MYIKKFVPVGICLVILLICIVFAGSKTKGLQTKIDVLASEKQEIEAKLSEQEAEKKAASQEVVEGVTGLSEERRNRDDDYIGAFLNEVLTWHSYDEYCKARESVVKKYNPDSEFMDMFFPEVPCKISPDGTNYNRIDLYNLTMEYVDLASYIIDIHGDDYTYFTKVTVQSVSNDGESQAVLAIQYTVDKDGNVSSIKGIL